MDWTYRSGSEMDPLVRGLVAKTYGVHPAGVDLPRRTGAPEARIHGRRIEISRSRSAGYVAAACAGPGETFSLGIDIETVGPFLASATDPARFAEVVLAPQEMEWFRATAGVAEEQLLTWLLLSWVRKEAVMKSLHTGLDTSRGGLPPAAVVLTEPWEDPRCLSHASITVTDLPTPRVALDSESVMLVLAQNAGPVRRPRR